MGQELRWSEQTDGAVRRVSLHVVNTGREPVEAADVRIPIEGVRARRVLEHGWQSWSTVRRCAPGEVVPARDASPDFAAHSYLSTPEAAGSTIRGDQFLVYDRGLVGWLDGRHHIGTVEVAPDGSLTAVAFLDGVELAPGEQRPLDPLWIAEGDPGPLYSRYADTWGEVAGARRGAPSPIGWCSWYQYFQHVTPADIRSNLALAPAHGIEVVQIDDGYQAAIGDWVHPWPGWEEGVGALAEDIRRAGCTPGIWTAPFIVGENSRVFAEHPDWVVRHASGNPLRAVVNPNNWGGWTFALDLTRPEVLEWLRETYAALVRNGFDYHKIDFCFAGAMIGRRADRTKTRAQALRAGLEAVRDGIGAQRFLLGCGCPFGQAVGVVDAMRVSADVGPDWEPPLHWPGFREGGPAASNAIRASVLRAPLHRRLWVNDPDCVLLRPDGINLDERQRRALADVVAGTGGFTLLSDDLSRYGAPQWAELERLRRLHATADVPLDIVDPFADTVTVESRALRLDVTFPELHVTLTERS